MKAQQVEYVTNINQYLQTNNLRQLFFNLTSQLAKTQPDDPISYLIDLLDSKNHLRLIYIHGISKNDTSALANSLSIKYNYNLINMFEEFATEDINGVDNAKINSKLVDRIKSIHKKIKGAIICGYPNNHIQAQFMQKQGYFPQRMFIIGHDPQTMEKYYIQQGITPNKAKILNTRNSMNTQEVKNLLGNMVDVLPDTLENAKTIGSNILKIKDRNPYPLDSPRIVVLHPPYLQPASVKKLCSQFGLYFVSVQTTFLKYKSQKNTFRQYFSTELELGLIKTECASIVAKHKGFVLSGWPNNIKKLTFMKEQYLRPHIVFAFNGQKQELEKLFIKADSNNSQIFPLKPKPQVEEFRIELEQYNKLISEVKKDSRTQIFPIQTAEKEVMRAFQSLIIKPDIYK